MADLFEAALAYSTHLSDVFGYVQAGPVGIEIVPNALITERRYNTVTRFEGAVYDEAGALLPSSLGFSEGEFTPIDPPTIDRSRFDGSRTLEAALYGGTLFPIMGHFLFETVARLWHGMDLGRPQRGRGPGLPVIFHPWHELNLLTLLRNPLYRRTFEALGVMPRDIVLAHEDLRVERLYVPSTLSVYHKTLHPMMGRMLDHLAAALTPRDAALVRMLSRKSPAGARIFLSRSRWKAHTRIKNERALEELFRARGFAITHPQSLTPGEMISLLGQAETVAASDGSQAHLMAFCRAGTQTLLIDTRPVPTQHAIEKLRGLRGLHIPVYLNGLWDQTTRLIDVSTRMEAVLDLALAHDR